MTNTEANFASLLESAVKEPGTISQAYSAFHNYSIGNQLYAMFQCSARDIPLGPIGTFQHWKALGRHVSKGSKAISLCMPITCKRKAETEGEQDATFTRFVFKNNWFVMAQTEGADYTPDPPADWSREMALSALGITEEPFKMMNGNCQGYARELTIAINPVAVNPYKTTFHELAHVIIGHTAEGELQDGERTERNIRELEAEATAMLVCAALGLPGLDESRGYIQHWYGSGQAIPEPSARKIFKAADAILKAGRPVQKKEQE